MVLNFDLVNEELFDLTKYSFLTVIFPQISENHLTEAFVIDAIGLVLEQVNKDMIGV